MQKEEYQKSMAILHTKKLNLQTQFLFDATAGNFKELQRKLKEDLYILQVEIDALRTKYSIHKLQRNLTDKTSANDTIKIFINECLILNEASRVPKNEVFEAYTHYCSRKNLPMKFTYQSFCKRFITYFPIGKVHALRGGKTILGKTLRTQLFHGISIR